MANTRPRNRVEIGIIGAGVIGLSCALRLVEMGYQVKIVARDHPGDNSLEWASPWAGAVFAPTPSSKGHYLIGDSFQYFWALAHKEPQSGVQKIKVVEYYDDRESDVSIWYKNLMPSYKKMVSRDLPEGVKLGFSYTSLAINPAVFLPWMKKTLSEKGVLFMRRTVDSVDEARQVTGARFIINASGLGAGKLAHDKLVVAHRGQTMFIKENSFDHVVLRQGSEYTYAIPRMYSGGVIVGGISQKGNMDARADQALKPDILRRVNHITSNAFEMVDLYYDVVDIVGFRPGREGSFRLEQLDDVIHAYGFGGLGYAYAPGVSVQVANMVKDHNRPKL